MLFYSYLLKFFFFQMIFRPLLDRQLKMEVIISSIENNSNIAQEDEETKKEQV
jgi:hypothetical protein